MSEEKTHELPKPVSQDDPTGRKWTWEEDEYTVIRTHARTGPGCHDNCGVLMYVKDGVLEKIEGIPRILTTRGGFARDVSRSRRCFTTKIA